jgi:hypothetical protein
MGRAKDIKVLVMDSARANAFVKEYHYSGSVVNNSVLHFGCFLDGVLGGVMQYGNPIDKRNVLDFVETDNKTENSKWNEMLELNRLAFSDLLPRNSESRCIAVSIRLIKIHAPHIKWILSFADGTQCGDGTIYRAAGFHLCGIKRNSTIYRLKDGRTKAKHGTSKADFTDAERLEGYQIRYIYLIDKTAKLKIEELPYSAIQERGAGMYLGEKRTK